MRALECAVLGAGSWGTALAMVLARNGHSARLWGRDSEAVARMRRVGENSRYLPGVAFPAGLTPEPDLLRAVGNVELVLVAVPSAGFRGAARALREIRGENPVPVVWAAKGLEPGSALWLHEVAEQELGADTPLAVLSGPSFAREVALGLPTAVTIASANCEHATRLAQLFHHDSFRVYTSQDVIGVELGGAVKNVLAIAAGVSDGLGYGANARAALITRGLHEITSFGVAVGARCETLMGLSGLGDLVLTCTDDQSRNRRFGLAVGRGQDVQTARSEIAQAIEGIAAAEVVSGMARRLGVDMPICRQVDRVLSQELDPRVAVRELLARDLKDEIART